MKALGHLKKRDHVLAMGLWSCPVSNWATAEYITALLAGFLFSVIITQINTTLKWVLLSFIRTGSPLY